jgi:methionyl-tRNA formyltransferase
MNSSCLVFAAKRVGAELFRYLLDSGTPVRKVIAGSADDHPIIELAGARGVDCVVYDADTQASLQNEEARYDWLLNLWSAHILKPATLDLADHRLNVHPGLVPDNRGNDCATWVIRNRTQAGVSLLEMDATVDGGAVYATAAIDFSFPCTGRDLMDRLSDRCIELFKETWPDIHAGKIAPRAQPETGTTYRRRQTIEDRTLAATDTRSLSEFLDWALAHDFAPATTAVCERDGRRYAVRVRIERLPD